MGILQDLYIKRLTQSGSLQNPPMAQYQQENGQQPQQNSNPGGYWSDKGPRDIGDINIAPGIAGGGYYVPGPLSQTQQQMPQVDTSNAIQSMAQLMGPTPAEREAQERKLLENKRKMIAWTGLFDGLRHLGNLYYASKGATPQQYTDKPYQQIEQNYMQERQLQDYLNRYSQAYAKQLFDWQQKMSDTERRDKIANAQAKYYDTRDEIARQKAELDKFKSVRVIKQKDGSLMKFDPVSGSIEPLTEADPLYVEYMNSRINATNKRAGLIGAPVTTTTTDAKGNTRTSVKTYGGGGGNSKKQKRSKTGGKSTQNSKEKISTGVNWKTK